MAGRGSVNVIIRGPVVEGKTAPLVARMIREVDEAIADDTRDAWWRFLKGSVRVWSGAYGRTLKVTKTAKQIRVSDNGTLPYGRWLEGTSRRNKVSRFKGYEAKKRAMAYVAKRKLMLAQRVVDNFTRDVNG